MNLLLVKTSSLGDVIHTFPALSDAHNAQPQLRIDWVVEEAYAELAAWHPAVARVVPVAQRRWRRRPWSAAVRREWRVLCAGLREHSYDIAVDAQGLLKSAWLIRQVDAPRCGYDRASAREALASLAYQRRIGVARDLHAIERIRRLLAAALDYTVPATAPEFGLSSRFPRAVESAGSRRVLLLHGTARADKLWPEQYWVALCERLHEAGMEALLPWGNAREKRRAERIAAQVACASVLPAADLAGVAAVLQGVRAVVALDTGLGHLAAALGVPTVSLYGRSDPGRTGTVGPLQRHLRLRPSRGVSAAGMMLGLEPERVWSALYGLLEQSDEPASHPLP